MPHRTDFHSHREPPGDAGPSDRAHAVLAALGLIGTCLVSFVLGAAVELLMPPAYLESLAGQAPVVAAARPRPAVLAENAQAPLGAAVPASAAARVAAPAAIPSGRPDVNVVVLNGTGRTGLANEAAEMLRASGWTVWDVGDADRTSYTRTEILTRKLAPGQAPAIGRALNLAPLTFPVWAQPKQPGLESSSIDYVVILGQDFIDALRVPVTKPGMP